ncbi:MAG: GNAT family N-acetyltransferase [Candidatus Nitrosocaldus sp.]|nr:GNAT family N-acetyltransferase [Candidatus Nitrosocaldus sp.]MDW8275063.1 GNAT family N-acetyltransferase [Candidatus Nitrosocaldus sp.]
MSEQKSSITVRRARVGDIEELCDVYLELSPPIRRLFHPFPFERSKLRLIFLVMILSDKLIRLVKHILPKLGFSLIVAYDEDESRIVGFIYIHIIGKENDKLIANLGITVREGVRSKGIGTKMEQAMIDRARQIGIGIIRFSVIEDNTNVLGLHKKFGFTIKGYTKDDYWDGKFEKNLLLELELE